MYFDPSTPVSDWERMFPHNINTIVSRLVTGMKKITVWRLLVDPIPNSLNWHPKNFTADIKENYQKHLGIERVKKWHIVNKTVFSWYYVILNVLSGFWWENLNRMSFTAFWMRLFSRYQPLKNLQLQGELWNRTGIVKGLCCCLWLHCCALIGLLLLLTDCCAVKKVWTFSTEWIMQIGHLLLFWAIALYQGPSLKPFAPLGWSLKCQPSKLFMVANLHYQLS